MKLGHPNQGKLAGASLVPAFAPPNPAHIHEKAVAEAARLEFERRRAEEPLRYVKFNPACERYADEWANLDRLIILFLASNAIGKSWSTATLLGWTIWPEMAPPRWRASLEARGNQIHNSFRICSTPAEIGEQGTLQNAIKDLWPKGRYESQKNKKAYDSLFKTDTGWMGDVMSYEQDAKEFEGATRGLIIYNEPPPRPIRKACVYRTRMGGMEVFPATPLADAAWIKDELVDEAPNRKEIALVGGRMEEACKEHSPNGHLAHERIEFLISEMDEDERPAREQGAFMHLSGVILKRFDRRVHMAQTTIPVQPLAPKFQVIDPGGFNKPFFIIWGQVVASPLHGLQILREWPPGSQGKEWLFEKMKQPKMTVADYAKMFKEVEDQLGFVKDDVHRIMDRRFGNNPDLTAGRSLAQEFGEDHDYVFNDSYTVPEKNPEIKTGITNINNYLAIDPLTNAPRMLLDPTCVNTARACERWALDPKTQKPKDDVWKNGVDVVRYVCSANLLYFLREPDDAWNRDMRGVR